MAYCKHIFFIALVFSLTLLSGCGGSGKTSDSDSDSDSDTSTVISLLNQEQLTVSLNEKSKQYTHSFRLQIMPLATDITLDYHTKNGSAVAGSDYLETKGTLILAKGTTLIKVDLAIMTDNISEGDETFSLIFNNAKGAKFSNNVTELIATITLKNYEVVIEDDVVISVVNQQALTVSLVEKNNQYSYSFNLQITPLAGDITLDYHTKSGSATAGEDFLENKGTLKLAKGSTTIKVDLEVKGDTTPEEDEVFSLIFDNPIGAKFANNVNELTATITLKNDDAIISVIDQQALNVSLIEKNNQYTYIFNFQIAPLATDITLDYRTKNGSAIAGSDYVDKKGTLILAKGSTAIRVSLEILGDLAPEEDETFSLIFDNIKAATLENDASKLIATITLKNDDATISLLDKDKLEKSIFERSYQYVYTYTLNIAPLAADITLDYSTESGSATGGDDFVQTRGSLTLVKGSTAITIDIVIIPDNHPEEDETFSLLLHNVKGGRFANNISALIGIIKIKDNYDTPVATKALSGILISSIPPILVAESLSTQPDAFANALLVGTNDTATIACPDSGTFSYVFTDINADDQYKDIDDIFAITVDKCVDGTKTSDGTYSLTIKATSTTATEISKETAILFEDLNFNDNQKSSIFTGLLNLTSTEPLNGIDPLIVDIASTQIKLKSTETYDFSALISSVATDAITNETTVTKYDAQLLLSNSPYDGQYKISILEPLKRSVLDDYPYEGKIKIERIDAVMNIMLTVLNSQEVKLETDITGDGITNHVQDVLWSDLSDPF
jgi:hypothetical protein